MKTIRFEPQHFARLHQSLCKYLNENTYDAKAFCYVLYLANQDTFYELSQEAVPAGWAGRIPEHCGSRSLPPIQDNRPALLLSGSFA